MAPSLIFKNRIEDTYMSKQTKSQLKFKFLKPMGLVFADKGNFFPEMVDKMQTVPGRAGLWPFHDYDYEKIYTLDLLDEIPAEWPSYFKDLPEAVHLEYLRSKASQAAEYHEANNTIRRQAEYYAEMGYIEIISDTFIDGLKAKEKAAVVEAVEPDEVPVPKPSPKNKEKAKVE